MAEELLPHSSAVGWLDDPFLDDLQCAAALATLGYITRGHDTMEDTMRPRLPTVLVTSLAAYISLTQEYIEMR